LKSKGKENVSSIGKRIITIWRDSDHGSGSGTGAYLYSYFFPYREKIKKKAGKRVWKVTEVTVLAGDILCGAENDDIHVVCCRRREEEAWPGSLQGYMKYKRK